VKVYPSLLHLLMTQFVAQRMALIEPQLTLRLPGRPKRSFDLEELEREISSAVAQFVRDIPVRKIDVTDGSAEIGIANQPVIDLQEVAVQSVSSPGELSFEISGRSALWDRLSLEGKIFPEHLVSQLNVAVVGLRISQLLQFLPTQMATPMSEGEASFRVKIASVGLRQVKAAVDGSTGPITLIRQNRTAKLQIEHVKSAVVYADEGFKIDIEELDLGSPHLKASGQIKIDPAAVSTEIKARNIDITEISDLALRMVDGVEGLEEIRRYLPAGILSEINVQSAGRSIADLMRSKNIVLSGLLRDGKIFIPGPELELVNVTGAVRFAAGNLQAKDITANLGTMKAWNGRLTLGFRGKRSPFHFDTAVHTRASELRSVILKLVRDEALRAELLKIRDLEGELSGRLVLGETIDAISPVVEISKTDIRATYAPLPIAITGGRLNYNRKTISLEHAEGSVGRSNFTGVRVGFA
jgi:hypothetical protein